MKLQNIGIINIKDEVQELVKKDMSFLFELQGYIHRFQHNDLGGQIELKSDPDYNVSGNSAIIIGRYFSSRGKIWIIKDKKSEKTVVMLPGYYDGVEEEEYL